MGGAGATGAEGTARAVGATGAGASGGGAMRPQAASASSTAAIAAVRTADSRGGVALIAVKLLRGRVSTLSGSTSAQEPFLDAWRELFSTDIGLMSLGVLLVMLGIGVFFVRWFQARIREDTAARDAAARAPR